MLEKTLKSTKVAIFSRTLWCCCKILLVFSKYKGFGIVTPRLLFDIFNSKLYVNIYTENIINFFIQFSLRKFYKIII